LLRALCFHTEIFINIYIWTSTDGKTQNQIDHILTDRRWHASILDVRTFRGAYCETDFYLLVAKVRESLAVRKLAAQKFDGVRFNLRKLNDLEVRKQYRIEITNRFASLENLSDDEDINRAWESIKENIKTSTNSYAPLVPDLPDSTVCLKSTKKEFHSGPL
jgi:hypothetical protein